MSDSTSETLYRTKLPWKLIQQITLALFLLSALAVAQAESNTDNDGVILKGYDPVAYFDGEPTQGNRAIRHTHEGATYHFSSDANRDRFAENPTHYAPEFGGYCAYGVRMGKKLDIDPLAYAVENDKLYVLLNRATLKMWDQERSKNIEIAEHNWPKLDENAPATE